MKETSAEAVCINIALTTPKYHDELFDIINTHEYFDDLTQRQIIKACLELRNEGRVPDMVSVTERSKIAPKEIFSYSRIEYSYDWQSAALSVREKWMFRKFKEACSNGMEGDYEDIFDLLTKHSETVDSIVASVDSLKVETIQDIAIQAINQIATLSTQGALTGAPSGISKLDDHTRGFQPTDQIIVAARPGMGKTAFALTCATASQHHGTVLIFSIEMSALQLVKRMYTQDDRVTMDDVFSTGPSEELWPILTEVSDRVGKMDIQIFDKITHIEDIAAKVSMISRKRKVSLVIIDYLQICSTREKVNNEEQRISKISWKGKAIAKRSNVPVLMLSQLSREVESRGSKRPQLSDLRHSGSIEQDADMVIFLWRSKVYEMVDENGEYCSLLDIAKYRNGEVVEIGGVDFVGKHMRWQTVEGREVTTDVF